MYQRQVLVCCFQILKQPWKIELNGRAGESGNINVTEIDRFVQVVARLKNLKQFLLWGSFPSAIMSKVIQVLPRTSIVELDSPQTVLDDDCVKYASEILHVWTASWDGLSLIMEV
jgi:hypothetical protein